MRRDHENIVDERTMEAFMRYNNFIEDEFAVIPGTPLSIHPMIPFLHPSIHDIGCPKPNPAGSIASRLDLSLPESGEDDVKVSSLKTTFNGLCNFVLITDVKKNCY